MVPSSAASTGKASLAAAAPEISVVATLVTVAAGSSALDDVGDDSGEECGEDDGDEEDEPDEEDEAEDVEEESVGFPTPDSIDVLMGELLSDPSSLAK